MKILNFTSFALLTTFLWSCEKEDPTENVTVNETETTRSVLAILNSRITHLKELGFTLTIFNRNDETYTINIKANDIDAFGTEKNRFVSYAIALGDKLPQSFSEPGLLKYVFKTKNELKLDAKIYYCYTTAIAGEAIKNAFEIRLEKDQKVHISQTFQSNDTESDITINFKLE